MGDIFTFQLGKHTDAGMQTGGQDFTVAPQFSGLFPRTALAAQGAAMSLFIQTFVLPAHRTAAAPTTPSRPGQ